VQSNKTCQLVEQYLGYLVVIKLLKKVIIERIINPHKLTRQMFP